MSDADAKSGAATRFGRALGAARWLWRTRRVIEGAAIGLGIVLVLGIAGVVYLDAVRFDAWALAWMRPSLGAAVALVLVVLVLWRALQRLPDHTLAQRLEHSAGGMNALLASAAEIRSGRAAGVVSPALTERLYARAAAALGDNHPGKVRDRQRRQRALMAVAAVVLVGATAFYAATPGQRHALDLLAAGPANASTPNPYQIAVKPGDVRVLAGEARRIEAALSGFSADDAQILWRPVNGDVAWQREPMGRTPMGRGQPDRFEFVLRELASDAEYFVVAGGVRSSTHQIDVIPLPRVARIDLEYHYPAHTGLDVRRVMNGGAIAAHADTVVELAFKTEHARHGGVLQVEGEPPQPLTQRNGVWHARLKVSNNSRYRVNLNTEDGRTVAASPEHAIEVLPDRPPVLTVLAPGRDTKVTSVEEIEIRTEAHDDASVRTLELVMSVNGGAEEIVPLQVDGRTASVKAAHTVYMEERTLEPGDMVSYYLRANDRTGNRTREVQSDIYFMEVRPFDKRFRRAAGGGGGGGGGGGQNQEILAAQQRALVIALFNIARRADITPQEQTSERTGVLIDAQGRIRVRAEAIVRRTKLRRMMRSNRAYERLAEELPQAVAAMEVVERELGNGSVRAALPPARKALAHLQRADAAFRDVQVANRSNAGGGGGAAAQELTNLFKLEMDKFRDQYASVQHAQQRARQAQVDEVLRRLRQLAERQLRESMRANGANSADSQAALARAVEQLIRRLERLSAKQPEPQVASALEALKQAAQAMRQAAGNASDGQAGSDGQKGSSANNENQSRQASGGQSGGGSPRSSGSPTSSGSNADRQRAQQQANAKARAALANAEDALRRAGQAQPRPAQSNADKTRLAERLGGVARALAEAERKVRAAEAKATDGQAGKEPGGDGQGAGMAENQNKGGQNKAGEGQQRGPADQLADADDARGTDPTDEQRARQASAGDAHRRGEADEAQARAGRQGAGDPTQPGANESDPSSRNAATRTDEARVANQTDQPGRGGQRSQGEQEQGQQGQGQQGQRSASAGQGESRSARSGEQIAQGSARGADRAGARRSGGSGSARGTRGDATGQRDGLSPGAENTVGAGAFSDNAEPGNRQRTRGSTMMPDQGVRDGRGGGGTFAVPEVIAALNNSFAEVNRMRGALLDRGHTKKEIDALLADLSALTRSDSRAVGAAQVRDVLLRLQAWERSIRADANTPTPTFIASGQLTPESEEIASRYSKSLSESAAQQP